MAVDPQVIIDGLIRRGVPRNAAVGMAGNIAVESGYDPGINEIAPLVEGSRGGFGLIQWTGPRRKQLEAFAGDKVADLDTQLDFLVHELGTTEKRAAEAIYAAQSPTEAARLVSERFLRPGIPHLERRLAEAARLAGGSPAATPSQPRNTLAQPLSAPQNALAARQQQIAAIQQFMPQQNALNAEAFQSNRPQQPLYGFGAGNNPFVAG